MYVSELGRIHQQKVISFRAYLVFSIITFILSFLNAAIDPHFIHVISSLVIFGLGGYLYHEFQENWKSAQQISDHYEVQSLCLKHGRPAFVCHDAHSKFCPEVDSKIKEDAKNNGYDDRDLVEKLYQLELCKSNIFRY